MCAAMCSFPLFCAFGRPRRYAKFKDQMLDETDLQKVDIRANAHFKYCTPLVAKRESQDARRKHKLRDPALSYGEILPLEVVRVALVCGLFGHARADAVTSLSCLSPCVLAVRQGDVPSQKHLCTRHSGQQ